MIPIVAPTTPPTAAPIPILRFAVRSARIPRSRNRPGDPGRFRDAHLARRRIDNLTVLDAAVANVFEYLVKVSVIAFGLVRSGNGCSKGVGDLEWAKGDFAAELPEAPVDRENAHQGDESRDDGASHVDVVGPVFFDNASDGGQEILTVHAGGSALRDIGGGCAIEIQASHEAERVDFAKGLRQLGRLFPDLSMS